MVPAGHRQLGCELRHKGHPWGIHKGVKLPEVDHEGDKESRETLCVPARLWVQFVSLPLGRLAPVLCGAPVVLMIKHGLVSKPKCPSQRVK